MVKTISTPSKINVMLLNIKINRPKNVNMYGYDNKLTEFYGDILSLSKNI